MKKRLALSEVQIPEAVQFVRAVDTILIGKSHESLLALITLIAGGHLLIEDLPGMGKTTFVNLIAKLAGLQLKRIQFTNDLLPADILGTHIFNSKNSSFEFQPGPIFSEVVLGDELNRATPKTQSAFLQAMEEHKVTVDGKTYDLPNPFFLIATQNPSQQIGTFDLPESQVDRFMMKIKMNWPDRDSEKKMLLEAHLRPNVNDLSPSLQLATLKTWQKESQNLFASEKLVEYIQNILLYTREKGLAQFGLSPRAGIQLLKAARACAFLQNRKMVLPEDVQYVAPSVISHRLGLAHESLAIEIIQAVPIL